jgi:DNA helicase-4
MDRVDQTIAQYPGNVQEQRGCQIRRESLQRHQRALAEPQKPGWFNRAHIKRPWNSGEKSHLATDFARPHATDDAQFFALLRDILLDLASKPGEVVALLIRWFAEFFRPERSEWEFKDRHEYYSYIEEQELRTLQGELVRSFEELLIANWLYLNGIAYEYEPLYEHPLPENDRRAYTPDFRLKESGVYIEHFGVRKVRGPDGVEQLTTAPYIGRNSYLEGMAWKRQIHARHGTTLIETYSYERVENRLTIALAEKLKPSMVEHLVREPPSTYQLTTVIRPPDRTSFA